MKKYLILLITLLSIIHFSAKAQKENEFPDSVKYKRNVIRWNLTPFLIWSTHNINFSYERVVKPQQSFSVNVGYFELPKLANGALLDSLNVAHANKTGGFNFAADYRFYFKKLNPGMAPKGLYWGPYTTLYHYGFENTLSILNNIADSSNLTLNGKLSMLAVGVELGYQFIIKERLSIDIIFMGPAFCFYQTKFNINGNLNVNQENEYVQKIYNALSSRIPGFDELVNDGYTHNSGVKTNMGPMIRYMIQIGYRF